MAEKSHGLSEITARTGALTGERGRWYNCASEWGCNGFDGSTEATRCIPGAVPTRNRHGKQ